MAAQRPAGDASPASTRLGGASIDSPAEPDWTEQVTDLIVDLVDNVRDKTTGPILTVARGLVYGTIILVVASVLMVAGLVLGGRVISLIPVPEFVSYAVLGALFTVVGMVCWKRRHP